MRTAIKTASLAASLSAVVAVGSDADAADWQISGSGCNYYKTFSEDIKPDARGNALQFPAGRIGYIFAYCPVTDTDINESTRMAVYVRDSDGSGEAANVLVTIMRTNKNDGDTWGTCQISSSHDGDSRNFHWQQITETCNPGPNFQGFDTSTYNYVAKVFLERDNTSENPKLFGIELY